MIAFSLARVICDVKNGLSSKKSTLLGGFSFRLLFQILAEGRFQHFGVLQKAAEVAVEHGELIAGADTLVHHHAQGHDLLIIVAAHEIGHRLTHADKHTGGAEIIAMMVDVAGADGGEVGNEQAGVEGAQLHDGLGEDTPVVQHSCQPHHKAGQQRDGQHEGGELVGAVLSLGGAVLGDELIHLLLNGENGVGRLDVQLQRRLVGRTVGQLFQHGEGHTEVAALIDFAVHYEVVDLGVQQHCLIVGRQQQRHVVDPLSLLTLSAEVLLHKILVHILGDGIHCVVTLGHDIGDGCQNGRQTLHSLSVRAHTFLLYDNSLNVLFSHTWLIIRDKSSIGK